jgi:predicted permease
MELWRKLWFLLHRRRFHREMDEEIAFHLEMKRQAAGVDSYAARKQFGNPTLLKEASREMWGWNSLERLVQDLRYALRVMRRSPGLSTVAILSLALGIGANTAIFTLVDAAMLRMLPVKDPEHLTLVMKRMSSGTGRIFSYPAFTLFREQNHSLDGIFAYISPQAAHMSAGSSPENVEQIRRSFVSGEYFSVLGVQPILGRAFSADDDKVPGGAPYAVLNYNFWKSRFSLDPGVIGKALVVDEIPVTVIGVAPPGFTGVEPGYQPDLWLPAMMSSKGCFTNPGCGTFGIFARVKPGVTLAQAQAELDVLHRQHLAARALAIQNDLSRKTFLNQSIMLEDGRSGYSSVGTRFSKPLLVLMAVVGAVLLIACANVANLLLARATARRKEVSVRLAMGAGRLRLIRQFLTESSLLAVLGGGLGLLFAFWGSHLLVALATNRDVKVFFDLRPDLRVLGFTTAVSLLSGVLFGIAPALRATRTELAISLKETARSVAGASGFNIGKVLVVSQVALSLLLLVGAGLFVRSLQNLRGLDPGFQRQNVLIFDFATPKAYQLPQIAALTGRMFERLATLPGVLSVSTASPTPLDGGTWDNNVTIEGRVARPDEDTVTNLMRVSHQFFDTMRTPLLAGRPFGSQDASNSAHVVLVNEAFARRFLGNANPLGRHISCPGCGGAAEIIGEVRDAKFISLREQIPATVFLLTDQLPAAHESFLVRTAGDPAVFTSALREVVKGIDRNVMLERTRTLTNQIDGVLIQERMIAKLSGFFGGLALLLASIGLYGVMSYAVVRRTNEIGIRMALGAGSGEVLRQILRETLILVVAGIVLGTAAALSLTRLVKTMLFGLTPNDPVTIATMALLLFAVALFAGYLPARRAARVDPMVALRYE